MVGHILSYPIQFLTMLLIARSLGASGFGTFGFAMGFSFIFSRFADAGLGILATREIAKERDRAGLYLGNFLFIKITITVTFYLIMVSAASLWGLEREELQVLYIVGTASFLYAFQTFLYGVFRACEQMVCEGALALAHGIAYLSLTCIVVYALGKGESVVYIAWCLLLAHLITCCLGLFVTFRWLVRPIWAPRWELVRFLAGEAVHLALAMILFGAYTRIAFLVLEAYCPPSEIGLFNVAFRLTFSLAMIPSVLAGAWLPRLSRSAAAEPEKFHGHADELFRIIMLIGIPLSVGLGMLASPLIQLLFGREFSEAAPVLRLLMGSSLLFFLSYGSKTLLESTGRQSSWALSLVLGCAVAAGLSLYFVPRAGAVGAGIAAMGANGLIAIAAFTLASRLIAWRPFLVALLRSSACGVLMGLCMYLTMPISSILAGVVGTITYGAASIACGAIRKTELAELRSLVQRPWTNPKGELKNNLNTLSE